MRLALLILFSFFLLSSSYSSIIIDGTINESEYKNIGSKVNSNSGFGTNIDVNQIFYYADATNQMLYLGIVGKLNTTSDDGIGIWLNISGVSGATSGTSLGISGGGHYIDGDDTNHMNFKADFEVDYLFALNPGKSATTVYFDAGSHVSTNSGTQYIGSCDQSGNSSTGPASNGIFSSNSLTFAFNNAGNTNTGFEVALPFSQIGATSQDQIEVFAFVVSNSAYFSDVTVPGNVTSGNLGFDPDFSLVSGGPYHTTLSDASLPVTLNSFTANSSNNGVKLQWITQSEVDVLGYEIQRAFDENGPFTTIASYRDHTELRSAGNTSAKRIYHFEDDNVIAGQTYWYKLVSHDIDGSLQTFGPVSATVELNNQDLQPVNGNVPQKFALQQNYPNPFNGVTEIQFAIPQSDQGALPVQLSVYDLSGKKVIDLIHTNLSAGQYKYKWNGKDTFGNYLPSGVYFYKLSTPKNTMVRKMLFVK